MKRRDFVAVRLTTEVRRQLDELMAAWGENQTQVVYRAIGIAWLMMTTGQIQEED